MDCASRSKIQLAAIASAFCLFIPNCLSSVPVPPAQTQPWTPPPTQLSPAAVSAITELFNQGLADPRGCDYREVEVKAGIDYNIKTHGWVLPGDGEKHFAVGWDGLVYPAATVGSPADLDKDVADQVANDQKRWSSFPGPKRDVRSHGPVSYRVCIAYDDLLPLKAAMLLRLGRADLAESVWNRWFALTTFGKEDPYLLLAREWTVSFYDRALFAHLGGDDAVSLAACRALAPIRSAVETVAAQRGFSKDPGKPYYLEDLEELPKLTADQERRAQEPPYVPVLASGRPAQGPERIKALIHDLELVSVRQMSNPGQTDVSTDPIVIALIKEGEPAVDPLLQCFEEDTRLTRSEFGEEMEPNPGPIIPVYEPAFAAIVGILKKPFYFSDSDSKGLFVIGQPYDFRDSRPRNLGIADRKFLAGKIRAYWDRNRSVALADRWYATLQDDAAGEDAWVLAVNNIVQPASTNTAPSTMFGGGWNSWAVLSRKAGAVLQGEPLRAKTNPSVSDLIVKRFKQAVGQSDKSISFDSAGNLMLALAEWDGRGRLDDLREMAQAFHARFAPEQGAPDSTIGTQEAFYMEETIYQKRASLGDPRALQDYADWLMSPAPGDCPDMTQIRRFQLMWEHPTEPLMQDAAEKIFGNEHGPWGHITDENTSVLADILTSPLIGMAAFREEVDRGLTDETLIGTVKIGEEGSAEIKRDGRDLPERQIASRFDPLAPAAGSEVRFRMCDYYAFRLSKLDGFPACEPYWPLDKRDEAVAACRAFLRQYGDGYQWDGHSPDVVFGFMAQIHFPTLDHPATEEDVKAGRAIFSLPGKTRLCPMPPFPVRAYRPSRKTDPVDATQSLADGTSKHEIRYTTEGRVWQAEEMLVDGNWERHYGFVGRHQLEKTPAGEIRFAYRAADGNITKEINGTIEGPEDYVRDYANFSSAPHHFSQLGTSLPVKVKISNGSGFDQPVPPALMLPAGAKMMLPQGISLSLSYSEKLPPKDASSWGPRFDYGSWQDIPLRKEVQIDASNTPGHTLIPAQDFTVLDIDLRDFFDMSRPGTYRLKALFQVPGQAPDKSNEITFSVADAVQ